MDLAHYAVEAVVLEGRSIRAVAGSVGMSKSWVAKKVGLYRSGGYEALVPLKRGPRISPNQTPAELEDEIILMRKQLCEEGFDGGPKTIRFHLERRHGTAPSVSTIHRVLTRRGFVEPQPQKRPRNSWIRFESNLPNETWQSDMTHWSLADGSKAEILNFVDDYSRMVLASVALGVTTAPDVVATFYKAASQWGFPASILTDNGCIFTAAHKGGRCGMETELAALGIIYKHGKPYHPQTQGKVERFHQTLKKWLEKQPKVDSIAKLQAQVDWFVRYYNETRPHTARGKPPKEAWDGLDKACPDPKNLELSPHTRVRHDRIDGTGRFTLRHNTKLHHICVGRAHKRRRIIVLVAGLDIRVLSVEGELLRHLTLDPTKDYQPITAGSP